MAEWLYRKPIIFIDLSSVDVILLYLVDDRAERVEIRVQIGLHNEVSVFKAPDSLCNGFPIWFVEGVLEATHVGNYSVKWFLTVGVIDSYCVYFETVCF